MKVKMGVLCIAGLMIAGCVSKPTIGYHRALHEGNVEEVHSNLHWPDSKFIGINSPVDKTGRMPLYVAEYGHLELVKSLLAHGAEVNGMVHSRGYDYTPLQIAEKNKHEAVAVFLRANGAKDYPAYREIDTEGLQLMPLE